MNSFSATALLLLFAQAGTCQDWKWGRTAGSNAKPEAMIADGHGNIYTSISTGSFISGVPLCSGSSKFLARHDSLGQTLWIQSFSGSAFCSDIDLDHQGNVYITGGTGGGGAFCGGMNADVFVPKGSTAKAFLAKYDSQGNLTWVRSWENPAVSISGVRVSADSAGNTCVYASGFGQDFAVSEMRNFNAWGQPQWTLNLGEGYDAPFVCDIAHDRWGNFLVAGNFSEKLAIPGYSLAANTPTCKNCVTPFIGKIGPGGYIVWLKTLPGNNQPLRLATDGTSRLYVASRCFPSCTTWNSWTTAGLLQCIGYDGNILSSKVIYPLAAALDADAYGNIWLAGKFQGNLQYTGSNGNIGVACGRSTGDMILLKLDSALQVAWAATPKPVSPEGGNIPVAIAHFSRGAFLTGVFSGSSLYGFSVVNDMAPAGSDMFLARITDAAVTAAPSESIFKCVSRQSENAVSFSCDGPVDVHRVTDVLGRTVHLRVQQNPEETIVETRDLPPGIYLAVIHRGGFTSVSRFLKF